MYTDCSLDNKFKARRRPGSKMWHSELEGADWCERGEPVPCPLPLVSSTHKRFSHVLWMSSFKSMARGGEGDLSVDLGGWDNRSAESSSIVLSLTRAERDLSPSRPISKAASDGSAVPWMAWLCLCWHRSSWTRCPNTTMLVLAWVCWKPASLRQWTATTTAKAIFLKRIRAPLVVRPTKTTCRTSLSSCSRRASLLNTSNFWETSSRFFHSRGTRSAQVSTPATCQ